MPKHVARIPEEYSRPAILETLQERAAFTLWVQEYGLEQEPLAVRQAEWERSVAEAGHLLNEIAES